LHRCVLLEPHKFVHVVVTGESADGSGFVFVHTLEQRGRHAYVQRAVATACKDVDARLEIG